MAAFQRIVLTDSEGGELFSGSSMLSTPPAPPTSGPVETAEAAEIAVTFDDEPCPDTLRSSEWVCAAPHDPEIHVTVVEPGAPDKTGFEAA